MIHISAHGAQAGNASVSNFQFARPMPLANEVVIDILFCGICHSDVELLRNNWGMTKYPCVPGHEATGRVTSTGSDVAQTHVGDYVGVGCMIDSCRQCVPCKDGWENHCEGPNGPTMTYNGYLMPSSEEAHNFNTFGAWANRIVVREEFIVPIPKGMDLARTAPLMCPGTATFGPLTRFCIKGGDKIGIVGLGGPGHLAVQMAKAMGACVTVFTTHERKRAAALSLGADEVVLSTDRTSMDARYRSLDYILSTVPVPFDPTPFLKLLRRRGIMTCMGLLGPYKNALNNFDLAAAGLSLTGSMIGSLAETKRCLEFCKQHQIVPRIEIIQPIGINEAIERLKAGEVEFRFVIDTSSKT